MAGVLSTLPSADNARAVRLWSLVVDLGTLVLRHTFDSHNPPDELQKKLNDPYTRTSLNGLRKKKVILQKDWDILYPLGSTTPSTKDFDITLLSVVLRNLCNLDKTSPFWKDTIPSSRDVSEVADISRIRRMKNEFSHMKRAALKKEEYEQKWNEMEQSILRLGIGIPGLAENIKKRKNCEIDPEHTAQYLKETEVNCRGVKRKMTNTKTNGDENASKIKIQRESLNDLKKNQETGQSNIGSLARRVNSNVRCSPPLLPLPTRRPIFFEHRRLFEDINESTGNMVEDWVEECRKCIEECRKCIEDINESTGNMNTYEDTFEGTGIMNMYEESWKCIEGNMNTYEDTFEGTGNMNMYEDINESTGNMDMFEDWVEELRIFFKA